MKRMLKISFELDQVEILEVENHLIENNEIVLDKLKKKYSNLSIIFETHQQIGMGRNGRVLYIFDKNNKNCR